MTTPSLFRLTPETNVKIAALAERWGGIEPTTRTAVLVEAIDRAYAAEFAANPGKVAHASKK